MEKNTILAIVISLGIFIAFFAVQEIFFKNPAPVQKTQKENDTELKSDEKTGTIKSLDTIVPVDEKTDMERTIEENVNVYKVLFSTKGGLITSIKLKEYKDIDGTLMEMVVSEKSNLYPFGISFNEEYNTANDIFHFKSNEADMEYTFTKEYKITKNDADIYFTLTKTYKFNDPYIIDLVISIKTKDREYLPLNFNGNMYTLTFGPQIGPKVVKFDENSDFRKYLYFDTKARKDVTGKVASNKNFIISQYIAWAAIEGKYFIAIADPPGAFTENTVGFDTKSVEGLFARSGMFFNRPFEIDRDNVSDNFKFYIGPKIKDVIKKYTKNDFDKVISENILFDWLGLLLQYLLVFLNYLTHNWGVAIILMTLIVKLVFFPLSQKGYQSAAKMQMLNPFMEEIKTKYKDDPQRIQKETTQLYSKYKINPLMGCLPMLIQIPIFLALLTILRNQFELRGAIFISGWINDLSAPENLLKLPFTIPYLNWTHLNILPIVMTGTTFIQQMFTASPSSGQTAQMKIMLYALPIVFFFWLYNMPSGLVLYWTVQNIFSVLQQMLFNMTQKNKKTENAVENTNKKTAKGK